LLQAVMGKLISLELKPAIRVVAFPAAASAAAGAGV